MRQGWSGLACLLLTTATVANAEQNLVGEVPIKLVPLPGFPAPRTTVMLAKGDTLIRYGVVRAKSAQLAAAQTFKFLDFTFDVPADQWLRPVYTDYRMANLLPRGVAIYCLDPRRDGVMTWLLPFASRFGINSRLCLVDTDADMKFDKGFLAGARSDADRAVQQIAPVDYSLGDRPDLANEQLHVTFGGTRTERFAPMARFILKRVRASKEVAPASLAIFDGKRLVLYTGGGTYDDLTNEAAFSIPKSPTPWGFQIGTLTLEITAVDRVAQTIGVQISSEPKQELAFVSDPGAASFPAGVVGQPGKVVKLGQPVTKD